MTKNIDKESSSVLLEGLERMDISDQQGRVYLALLSLGETGISHLERETGLHRQILYNALAALEKKGVAKHAIFNGRRRFSAQPPRRLLGILDEKRRQAETLVERLNDFSSLSKQEFEIYQGDRAFVDHQLQTLYEAEEGETLDLIGTQWERFYATMGETGMDEYEKLRKGRNIAIRYIGSETQRATLLRSINERPLFAYKILPRLSNGLVNTSIWNRSVIFNFFGNPVIAFVLRDASVAQGQREFFETLWKLAVK